MKKRLSILMLSLAVILTMVAVNIHHHHHGEQMYIVLQENCEAGSENGQENQHDQEENEDHTQHFMPAAFVQLASMDAADHHFHGFHFFFSFLPSDILASPLATVIVGSSTPKHPSILYSSLGRLCRGLRAPPVVGVR